MCNGTAGAGGYEHSNYPMYIEEKKERENMICEPNKHTIEFANEVRDTLNNGGTVRITYVEGFEIEFSAFRDKISILTTLEREDAEQSIYINQIVDRDDNGIRACLDNGIDIYGVEVVYDPNDLGMEVFYN